MRRGTWIAVAVLVPFALLIAAGFALMRDPSPPPVVAPVVAPPPRAVAPEPAPVVRVEPVVAPAPAPVAVVEPARVEPVPPTEPGSPPEDLLEELARDPVLADVTPMVVQCFMDAKDRVHEPRRVTVTWGISDAGRFEHVAIKKSTWADPQIDACVLDSFEDARPAGPMRAAKHQAHTFTFSPADAGR